MPKKKKPFVPVKQSTKAGFGSLTKEIIADLTGYRPLSTKERERLGIPKTTRAYTTQREGVKRLDASKVAPRKRVEQQALTAMYGRKVTLEEKAARNFEMRGLRSPLDRYQQLREKFILNKYQGPVFEKYTKNGVKKLYPAKLSVVNADKEFKQLYADAKRQANISKDKRRRSITIKRLRALNTFFPEEGAFHEYLQRYPVAA